MTHAEVVHVDQEAERSVLGAVFLAETALQIIEEERVAPSDFYWRQHGEVLAAMLKLVRQGQPVDPLTVRDQLARDRKLTVAGGRAGIDSLAASVPAVGNLRRYCQIVKEKSRWRARLAATHEQLDAILHEDLEAHSRALASADQADKGMDETRVDPAADFLTWAEKPKIGLATPWKQLTDGLGGGLLAGDVTVLGGWPGMGKSVIADMFLDTAAREGARCHMYMSEMLAAARTARYVARHAGIVFSRLMQRPVDLNSQEWDRVFKCLQTMPYEYEKIEAWPVEKICRHMRRHRWEFAVIDTVSRVPARDMQEVGQVSGMLADTAREIGCHLLLLCQLNLERCKQPVKPAPTDRDLLYGGPLWRDARNVLFVHREQHEDKEIGRVKTLTGAKLYATKATHGDHDQAWVQLTFMPARMTFAQTADSHTAELESTEAGDAVRASDAERDAFLGYR